MDKDGMFDVALKVAVVRLNEKHSRRRECSRLYSMSTIE